MKMTLRVTSSPLTNILFMSTRHTTTRANRTRTIILGRVIYRKSTLLVLPPMATLTNRRAIKMDIRSRQTLQLIRARLMVNNNILIVGKSTRHQIMTSTRLRLLNNVNKINSNRNIIRHPTLRPRNTNRSGVGQRTLYLTLFVQTRLRPSNITLNTRRNILRIPNGTILATKMNLTLVNGNPTNRLTHPKRGSKNVTLPSDQINLPRRLLPNNVFRTSYFNAVNVRNRNRGFIIGNYLRSSSLLFVY